MSKRELTALLYSNKNLDLMCKLNKSCYRMSMNMVTCINFVELTINVHKLKPQIIFLDLNTIEMNRNRLMLMTDSKEFKNIKIILVGTLEQCPKIDDLEQVGFSLLSQLDNCILRCADIININALKSIKDERQTETMIGYVSKLLFDLGFSPKHSGYCYLKDIISNILQNGGIVSSLINEQYPCIAVKFKTSPSNIERNIRNAITIAYAYEHEKWNDIFPRCLAFKAIKRPTNREFICMCVETLLHGGNHQLYNTYYKN